MEDKIAYFNTVAEKYFQEYHKDSPAGYAIRVRKKRVLELIDRSGGKVLDVGCGPGIMVKELLDFGYKFWGVDATPNMIEECNKNFENWSGVHFSIGDATDLKFPDKSFDLVICMGVIDRIEKYELAIREMMRVIKKDGSLIIVFPNLYSPYAAWCAFIFYPIVDFLKTFYCYILRRPKTSALLTLFVKLHTERGSIGLIRKYSGKVTDIVYFNFNIVLSPFGEIFPRFTIWLTKIIEGYRLEKLRWLGSAFIVKAKKIDKVI